MAAFYANHAVEDEVYPLTSKKGHPYRLPKYLTFPQPFSNPNYMKIFQSSTKSWTVNIIWFRRSLLRNQ
jgi:hypothetical protein